MSPSAALLRPKEPDLLRQATWLAATLGPFDPAELVGHVTPDPARQRAVAIQLASLCAEVSTSEMVLWNLKADSRRQALSEMQSQGVLGRTTLPSFITEMEVTPQDRFGRYLRQALTGKTEIGEVSEPQEIEARYAAYEFVGRAEVGASPASVRDTAGRVEQNVQRAAADQRLAQAVGPAFVGRAEELQALEQFALTGEAIRGRFGSRALGPKQLTPLVFISGIGGAGKSALIARLVQLLRARGSDVAATVLVDFDRPTLSSLNRIELSMELIRQISFSQLPIAPQLLELLRTALGEFSQVELTTESGDTSFRFDVRALFSIHSRLRQILEQAALLEKPLLLILDTFEEVLTLGEPFVKAIYAWLEDLRNTGGLRNLHVLVSGRALPSDLQEVGTDVAMGAQGSIPAHVVGEIHLGDLSLGEALELLTLRGVDSRIAAQLIERFGTNPLVLRLLGDYSVHKGAAAVRMLVRNKRRREQYGAEVAQRILYSRILGRIRNEPGLKALASPGLVVRVVTPGVIREVLAGPCGLGRIGAARAHELFTKLASQVWLVRRIGSGAIAHRRDMRTVMLPLVTEPQRGGSKARLLKQVRQIHRNAVEYFRSGRDENLAPEASFDEGIYHQLFVEPERVFEQRHLRLALTSLAGDLPDFPLAQRARLKLRLGRALTDEERESLSARELREYERVIRSIDVRHQGTARAVSFDTPSVAIRMPAANVGRQAYGVIGPGPAALEPNNEEGIAAAFARGDFAGIAGICADVLALFVERCVASNNVELPLDMSGHVTWMAALATLGAEKPAPSAQWLEEFCERVAGAWDRLRQRQLPDRSGFRVTHYLTALAILLSRGRPLPAVVIAQLERLEQDTGGESPWCEITSTGSLRIFQLLVTTLPRDILHLQPKAVNASCLQYFAGLLDPRYARKLDPSLHAVQRAWFTAHRAWRESSQNLYGDLLRIIDPLLRHGTAATGLSELTQRERSVGESPLDLYSWHPPTLRQGRMSPVLRRRTKADVWAQNWVCLRGMSPDLQAPSLTVLRERFSDPEGAKHVLRWLEDASPRWPVELSESTFNPDVPVTDTFLATVCHYADRFGALPLLFRQSPPGSVGRRVRAAFSNYVRLISTVR